jgi:DNA polymerase-3 subunit delta'
MSLYRDVLTSQLSAGVELVNQDLKNQLDELASSTTSTNTIAKLEAMALARVRIGANVRDLMVLESLAIQLRRKVWKTATDSPHN